MKTALFYGGSDIRLEELPMPAPGPGQVLLEVESCGVCGSDLNFYRGKFPLGTPELPQRKGHELAGTIVEVGAEVRRFARGQRVAVEPMHLNGCGDCRQCARGDYNVCSSRRLGDFESAQSAGFSQFDVADESNVFALPAAVPTAVGAITDVYACGLHALNRAPLATANAVAIVGTGSVAMTAGQLLRLRGVHPVVMIGRRLEILATAIEVGAADLVIDSSAGDDTAAELRELIAADGADVVLETVGAETTLGIAVEIAAAGGTIEVMGCFDGSVAIDYRQGFLKELEFRISNGYASWQGERELELALEALASGQLDAEGLISHRFALDAIGDAFATAADKKASGALKVLVEPQGAL